MPTRQPVTSVKRCAARQGAYHFHYFRTVGGIRPELAFLDPDTGEIVSPLAEAEALSDSQLAAEGRRLGLIRRPVQPAPARSRKRPIGAALPPLSSDDEGGETDPLILAG